MRAVVVLLLVGCGRFGFGEHGPRDSSDGFDGGVFDTLDAPDGPRPPVDVAALDATGLPPGLVVWFPFDDASAQNAVDVVSGFGGTCGANECPVQVGGHHGTAFSFDGSNDCIQVPDMGQFGQAQITIAIWMRQANTDSCSPMAKRVDIGASTVNSWQVETNTSNQVAFTSSHGTTGNTRIFSPTNTVVFNQWQHIAATYDGTTKRLYVNGVEVVNAAQAGGLPYTNHSVWFGCDDNNGTFVLRCQIALDDFQLYNRALTPAEIQMLAAM